MAIINSSIPVAAEGLRSTLKHTWLERRLLPRLQLERKEWLAKKDQGRLPEVLAGLPGRIAVAWELNAEVIQGYSPAQLVDQGVLSALPDDLRQILREAVHQAYLAAGIIQEPAAALEAALKKFEAVASQVPVAWRQSDKKYLADVLDKLEKTAQCLKGALEALPRGVVLP